MFPPAGCTACERQGGNTDHLTRGPATVDERTRWRVGNKNARNIYFVTPDGEELHVGVMFTASLGRYVVTHLNERGATAPPRPPGEVGEPAAPAGS